MWSLAQILVSEARECQGEPLQGSIEIWFSTLRTV